MKRYTDLRPGDLLSVKDVQGLFTWLTSKQLYEWARLYKEHPADYPPCAKIGKALVWSRHELVEYVNRQFAKMAS